MISQPILKFILNMQHELKSKRVPKQKWYKMIFKQYWSGELKRFHSNGAFTAAWKHLQDKDLVNKEKFVDPT